MVEEDEKMEYIENQLKYEVYHKLRESVGWHNFSEEQVRKALSSSLYSVVIFDEGLPIGMARVVGDGLYVTIVDVVVSPDYQGKGFGKYLINKVLEYIEKETPVGGRVSIQLIAEKGKETFYEKLGFKRIPHDYCGCGMRKVYHQNNDCLGG